METKLLERIQSILRSRRIVLFMKGKRSAAQCGFSAQVSEILSRTGVDFLDVDILADPELRQGLKEYAKWPTFPQLYVDGRLIGGADIVSSLDRQGELDGLLAPARTAEH